MSAGAVYDTIGQGYAIQRQPDPHVVALIGSALGAARTVLNVGAGTGSYEPADRTVVAVEPSTVMLRQRSPDAASAIRARAEALPFADRSFDAVMAVLTLHHWTDQTRGLIECARVARERVVLLTWDPASTGFWLMADYIPAFLEMDRERCPPLHDLEKTLSNAMGEGSRTEVLPVPIPADCVDGFLGAFWARPAAYLEPAVRAGISSFAPGDYTPAIDAGLGRLRAELASGAWEAKYGGLRADRSHDIGYRLVVAHAAAPELTVGVA